MSNIITGLDIGSASIKAIVAEIKNNGRLLVLAALKQPSAGFRKGVLVDFAETTVALRNIISDIRTISPKAVKNVYVNVNGVNIKSCLSKGIAGVSRADSEIRRDDIEKAIQSSRAVNLSSNYIVLHNITREFFVDGIGGIQDPLGMTGTRLEVNSLVIGAFSPLVHDLIKCLERNGVSVSGLIFGPLAASEAVLSKQQKDLGVLMVDIGAGISGLAIYEENKILKTISLPIGAGNITNDIAIGLRISIAAAEKVKLTYGFAFAKETSRREVFNLQEIDSSMKGEISKRFLSEIIEARLAEIFEIINNEIKNLGHKIDFPAGVVITGGGAKLPGIVDLARQELRLPVQIGLPELANFDVKDSVSTDLISDPEFATAVGLTVYGLNQEGFSRLSVFKRFLQSLIP
ncbi:cell division protein FtsA [Candidatus Jorgensenbacteria bacterium RIFCSPLOWO2_12_FULL_42_11]|uniref:Cell division protein FtsA n=1 Tax=Candidatus Jorgensenbacteria bacterium RIFCSPLOWO2_12_FULL_42_11 TaxID=1798473 RepID=A0A1F6C3H5_9BACT|nr:MAG: cell division protein FtsA [Candidatus Jorgensenbacteria bacterium RIFCSPLOWO2_12_FULL_42_11]